MDTNSLARRNSRRGISISNPANENPRYSSHGVHPAARLDLALRIHSECDGHHICRGILYLILGHPFGGCFFKELRGRHCRRPHDNQACSEGIMRSHHTFVPAITETSKTGRARRENHPLFSTFRDSTAAHAEPTFLQFIIGLTRHRYRRIPCNLSDRFHHRRRWTGNWY